MVSFFLWTKGVHLAFPPEPLLACTEKKGGGAAVKRGGAARSPKGEDTALLIDVTHPFRCLHTSSDPRVKRAFPLVSCEAFSSLLFIDRKILLIIPFMIGKVYQ